MKKQMSEQDSELSQLRQELLELKEAHVKQSEALKAKEARLRPRETIWQQPKGYILDISKKLRVYIGIEITYTSLYYKYVCYNKCKYYIAWSIKRSKIRCKEVKRPTTNSS